MSVQICTIIARNYLPAARVLAASFLEHHPDGQRERAQESAWADPGFHGAFAPGEGPVLVLKAING